MAAIAAAAREAVEAGGEGPGLARRATRRGKETSEAGSGSEAPTPSGRKAAGRSESNPASSNPSGRPKRKAGS